MEKQGEHFFASFKVLAEEGYLAVAALPWQKKLEDRAENTGQNKKNQESPDGEESQGGRDSDEKETELSGSGAKALLKALTVLKKGQKLPLCKMEIKEGETSPPKRYTSGSMILAMENAGQLIEDEDLRAQIKGSGIGTSATRAEIDVYKRQEQAMIKVVAGEEFVTANRMVAATKLAEGDRLACVREPEGEELVLLTAEGMVLKFLLSEVPELKKNSRGVRGMKLENGDKLEQVYFPEKEKTAEYRGKEITLGRLKLAKRDGKGTKVRLDR